MKNLQLFFLILVVFCMSSCRQIKVEIIEGSIYVLGEKLLEATDTVEYISAIFMEKQNAIAYIASQPYYIYEESEGEDEGGYFQYFYNAYIYDVKTKESKIIAHDFDDYISHLLKASDDSFYLSGGWGGTPTYIYKFATQEIELFFDGEILNIIQKGKYKNFLLALIPDKTEEPCNMGFWSYWIVDGTGKKLGCIDYTFDDDPYDFDGIKDYDFSSVKFIEPPRCNFETDLEIWHNQATEGLNYMQQYIDGNTAVETQIKQLKKECDEYWKKYETILDDVYYYGNDELLSEPQRQKLDKIRYFDQEYQHYKLPFSLEIHRHEFDYYSIRGIYDKYIYIFHATITNRTDKKITNGYIKYKTGREKKTGLFFDDYYVDVFDEAEIKIKFPDKTIFATVFGPSAWTHGSDVVELIDAKNVNENIDNIEPFYSLSTERPWKRGEKKRIKITLSFDGLKAIHFEYTPQSCTISIPFTVEDPTGYTYATYFKYDISDDWAQYARKIK